MASNGSLNNIKGLPKFGLILPNNKSKAKPVAPVAKKPLWVEDDDEDDDNDDTNTQQYNANSQKRIVNKELRAVQLASSKKTQQEYELALAQDPSVFDYDGVYDAMKSSSSTASKSATNVEKKPRYITGLLQAAEKRKVEQQRVMERKIQREREEEGDEFADKEKFVTGAYKQQQEELKRLEEEEKRKEALEEEKARKGDMTGFYRSLLDKTPAAVPTVVVVPGAVKPKKVEEEDQVQEEDKELVQKAIKKGMVEVNESEEVVDKRQLLSAGLNVTKKARQTQQEMRTAREQEEAERRRMEELEKERRWKELERQRKEKEQAARHRELILQQKREKEEQEKRKREQEMEEVKQKMQRKTTEDDVSEARRRYLERKKAMAQKSDGDSDSD